MSLGHKCKNSFFAVFSRSNKRTYDLFHASVEMCMWLQEADEEEEGGTESDSEVDRGSRASSAGRRHQQAAGQLHWMRLHNHDDYDDNDDVVAETAVGHRRQDALLPADDVDVPEPSDVALVRPDTAVPLLRPLVPAAAPEDAVVKATRWSSRLHKSRSDTRISGVVRPLSGHLDTSESDHASQCRLTLSNSTANWTALYEPPS